VTNAPAGLSAHNYGLGVDFVRMVGVTPSWHEGDYATLGEEAAKVGLEWGGHWREPDRPHVQWPGYVTTQQLLPLRKVYLANPTGPLTAVFYFLGNAHA
jgi:peptidoglycan L-alanyl-D-glutamate endopeptidase CwlK